MYLVKNEMKKPTKTTFCLLKTVSITKKWNIKKSLSFIFWKLWEIHGIVQYKKRDKK